MEKQFFTLEALNAFHGDCLILHYGDASNPKLLLIDGGPSGVFDEVLKPRLSQIAAQRKQSPFLIDHVIVTHLDNDHIMGVIDLIEDIREDGARFDARQFWFNTFDDLQQATPSELQAAHAVLNLGVEHILNAVVEQASINEGRVLRDGVLTHLQATLNAGGPILIADGKPLPLPLDKYMKASLVCPDKVQLLGLAKKWRDTPINERTRIKLADYADRSVFNLSSLVIVFEMPVSNGNPPRMLLTGDARGDQIIAGLDHAGLLACDPIVFDILKVPHHGSANNTSLDFFERVKARNYIISANGRHKNPSLEVLEWIAQTAPADALIWLTKGTRGEDEYFDKALTNFRNNYPDWIDRLQVRADNACSIRVDLLEPTT